ncbi:MAG: SPASM domain-containing protein [Nanoarchaeota archaeon]|nr:SPASM domain-containing protein [Nanoarchaeota archaeon]MBU1028039.1 SPASM domain-containing protein [Nanoarchaeota archaeon]
MNLKQFVNKFLNFYSYFHRKIKCLGYPEVYNIEPTNHCPMKCIMCPRKYMKRKLGHMDINLYKKIIDQLKGYTPSIGLHHFGESLLHPKLDKMIKYAKEKRIKTFISVNASVINLEMAKKIIDAGLDKLHISLDGTDPVMYKRIRGITANYEKAVSNINEIIKYKRKRKKPLIVIAMINMKITKNKIKEFKKKWDKQGVDEVEIKDFVTWEGSSKDIERLADKEQLSKAFHKRSPYPCVRAWHRMTILWDGRVVPCCYDYDAKYVLGDLNKESLKEIWNNQKMKKLRTQHIKNDFKSNDLCKNCKEKNGMPKSKLYPLNFVFLIKRIKTHFKKEV